MRFRGRNGSCQRGWTSLFLAQVKQKPTQPFVVLEGQCAGPAVCPLSRVEAGEVVCIKHLSTTPEVTDRLRELGFCEEQQIKLLTRESSYICQVCNARLGISKALADSIMVERGGGRKAAPRRSGKAAGEVAGPGAPVGV